MKRSRWFLGLAATLMIASHGQAKGPAFTDPNQAGPDYSIQGEYVGDLETPDGKVRVGVQVIAAGNGRFRSVGYHGGLPGDGWNGEQPVRSDSVGELQDGKVSFRSDHGTGTVENGKLSVDLGSDGKVDATLSRVDRKSPTLGQKPPAGAVVLFDGKNADAWEKGRIEDGLLVQGTKSKQKFGSHKLHIEFRLPFQPEDSGQGRGNSGLYLQSRYEVQMLDSFGLEGKQNECGGIYSVKDPDVNMCFPPLAWQTYDVEYTAAKYDDSGKLVASPRVTVLHNGVKIHDNVELPGNRNTTAAPLGPGPEPGPIYLQDHGNPVRYRNIWVVETN